MNCEGDVAHILLLSLFLETEYLNQLKTQIINLESKKNISAEKLSIHLNF